MFDDHRVRDLIIAQTGIEPWRLEMEEIDYGDRCGIFYRSPEGTVRGSVAAKNRSEQDVAQDLVQSFFTFGEQAKVEIVEVWPEGEAPFIEKNYTEIASFRVPADMIDQPVEFSIETIPLREGMTEEEAAKFAESNQALLLSMQQAKEAAPDYTGRAGRHPMLCICANCSKRRKKEEKKAARKAAKQALNGQASAPTEE